MVGTSSPVFAANRIEHDPEMIEQMWIDHEAALEDTDPEWNPNNFFLLPFLALRWVGSQITTWKE